MTTINKVTTVDTSNLQSGELINMEFELYNVTSILGFNSILTVVYSKTRMIWVFPFASKRNSFRIIRSILKTLKNERHPCKLVNVKISMETTGGDESCINVKNEIHNKIIHNMVGSGLLGSDKHEKNGDMHYINKHKYVN